MADLMEKLSNVDSKLGQWRQPAGNVIEMQNPQVESRKSIASRIEEEFTNSRKGGKNSETAGAIISLWSDTGILRKISGRIGECTQDSSINFIQFEFDSGIDLNEFGISIPLLIKVVGEVIPFEYSFYCDDEEYTAQALRGIDQHIGLSLIHI